MKLVVISSPAPLENEASIVNQLFEAGLQVFHLRKGLYTRAYYKAFIAQIDEAYHNRIALHQFHDLREDFAITRLHYTECFRKQTREDKTLQTEGLTLSTSIHQLLDIEDLKGFEYTFFGPVFNSISKPGYTGMLTEDFRLPKHRNNVKVIALGGIDVEKTDLIAEMGFDGLALLGIIWNDPSKALHNFKSIQEKC